MTTAPLWYILLVLIGYVLTVARLVRLINLDTVLDPVRIWLLHRVYGKPEEGESNDQLQRRNKRLATVEYFIGCPWCVGFWVALAVSPFPVLVLGLSWWWFLVLAAAASQIVGMAAGLWTDEDIEVVEE